MKNVAIIVQHLSGGGAERMAANMSIELSKKHNVYMVVFDSDDVMYPYGGNLVNLNIPPIQSGSAFKRISNIVRRTRVLKKFKKQNNIDCSISHIENANIVNVLSRCRDKVISVYHSMPSIRIKKSAAAIILQNFIARCSDKYIFVSKLAAQSIVKDFSVPEKKVKCIYNFCSTEKIFAQAQQGIELEEAKAFYEEHPQIIINMGRLHELKGQYGLIKSFYEIKKECPQSGLVILGEGEERDSLEKLVKSLGIEKDVYMPGVIENPFPYIKNADVFVLSSISEGLPMVLIEAAICECPIVSTDMKSGAREVLAPDTEINFVATKKEYAKYGVLVPVCDDVEKEELSANERILAEAIAEILSDEELCQRYVKSSKECAKNFSPDTIVEIWDKLIEM